jgi:hypothetical protein
MRLALSLLMLIIGVSAAHGQSFNIDRLEVLRPGIYERVGEMKTVKDKNISVGQRTESRTKNIEVTTVIPAREGIIFGATFSIIGSPKNHLVPLRIVWRYPSPGIIDPRTAAPKFVDEYTTQAAIGNNDYTLYWTLGGQETQIPGVWTLEVWHLNRKLASQNFTLTQP